MSTLNAFLRIFTEGRLPSVEVKTWNSFTIQIQVRQTTGPKSLDKRCLKTMERGKTNELFALLIFHHSALVELHNGPQSTVPALPKKYEPTWKRGPLGSHHWVLDHAWRQSRWDFYCPFSQIVPCSISHACCWLLVLKTEATFHLWL